MYLFDQMVIKLAKKLQLHFLALFVTSFWAGAQTDRGGQGHKDNRRVCGISWACPHSSLFERAVLIFLLLLAPVCNDKGAYHGLVPCHRVLFCFWKYQPLCDCRMGNCGQPPHQITVRMQMITGCNVVLMLKGW